MDPFSDQREAVLPWLAVVRTKVEALRYGTVQITVHDGRVTQVETIEKTRIDPEALTGSRLKPTRPSGGEA